MIYKNVKLLCEEQGLTIQELERKANLGGGTIGKWKDSNNPTVNNLQSVAKVLGVSVNRLIKGGE